MQCFCSPFCICMMFGGFNDNSKITLSHTHTCNKISAVGQKMSKEI